MTTAGIDEAGRGCLAGPVVAAAVILSPEFDKSVLCDSKQLTANQRENIFDALNQSNSHIAIGIVQSDTIDELNILNATLKAMVDAAELLPVKPTKILIDGNKVPSKLMDIGEAIVKGDQKIPAISAASIIAKVTRDTLMNEYDTVYPQYGFKIHKGYGTPYHYDQLFKYGPSPIHRHSFNLTKQQSLF